jgi:high-affinity iron transporter
MGQSLLVTLREGLEAGLIVVIILTYLRNAGQRSYWKYALLGTGAAVGVSILVGAVIFVAAGEFEGRAEQVFEGSAMLTAVAVLSWMIVWMKSQAAHIRGHLQAQVQSALAVGSALALAAIPFVAVLREGIETALFMFAAARTSTPVESTFGAGLGLAGALILSYAFYRGGRRINLRLFFNITGVLLILFAAGLLAHGIHEFHEARLVPPLVEHIWNANGVLSDEEGVGEWLKGIFGYNGDPSLVEAIAYPLYLGVAFWYFLRVRPLAPRVELRPAPGEVTAR